MKKILVIVLTAVLIISSMSVFASEVQNAGDSEDLILMKELGIMLDTYKDSDIITRMQLAEVYMDIAIGSAQSEYMDIKIPFSDVPSNAYSAGFVSSVGIMNGVGNGLFAPDSPVTYNQLIKSMISFLGYDPHAQSMGGYPSGYLTVASLKRLLIPAVSGDDKVNAKLLATTLKLALNVNVMEKVVCGSPDRVVLSESEENYLSLYKKIYRARGVLTATHATDLYSKSTMGHYDVRINDVMLMLSENARELAKYLGYTVDAYYAYDKTGEPYVLSFEVRDNTVLKITENNFVGYDAYADTISYYDGTEIVTAKIANEEVLVYNGTSETLYNEDTLNPNIFSL